jgi:hypothetical protein
MSVCVLLIALSGSVLVASVRCCVSVLLCFCVAVFLCCCVFVCVCVSLRLIGRSLRLSAAVVTQQRCNPGDAQKFEAAVVLSHDTSGCSCIFVALPPPSDAVPACSCVSAPVMRAAVCLRLGCRTLSCRCSACASLATVSGCLQSLFCCCCVPSACLHVHGVAVVVL